MRWLLKRALLLWLALIALCAAGVGIGKLDRAPDALQTLGFDVCDGEPCFRGIKPGMSWEEVQKRFPNAVSDGEYLSLPVNTANVRVYNFSNKTSAIIIVNENPIELQEVLRWFGPPCAVLLFAPNATLWIYPKLYIAIEPSRPDRFSTRFLFTPNSSVREIGLNNVDLYSSCDAAFSEGSGQWHGFTYTDIYQSRYRRAAQP
jgi:hypothetical protein